MIGNIGTIRMDESNKIKYKEVKPIRGFDSE